MDVKGIIVMVLEGQIQKTEEFIPRRLIHVMSSRMSFLNTKMHGKWPSQNWGASFLKERMDENVSLTQSLVYFSLDGRSTGMF